ncbi:MAG: hypothetical protein ACTHJW_23170 [Streptosporangiaceae bacterium]
MVGAPTWTESGMVVENGGTLIMLPGTNRAGAPSHPQPLGPAAS